ncbi:MAG: DUF4783 domain-containing protein [Salinivirgaceae bacterium]
MFLNKKSFCAQVYGLLLLLFLIQDPGLSAQTPADSVFNRQVEQAVHQADAKKLAGFFHPQVELILPGYQGIYSKRQSQFMLEAFFKDNQPVAVLHEAQSVNGNSYFVLCELKTTQQTYRFCYLVKEENTQKLIYQFRFEKK